MAREKDRTKRVAILEAAERLFAERGYHGTSVADMARETDLPVGSIYTYFANKEAVLGAVIEEGWGDFIIRAKQALARAAGPREALSILIREVLTGLFRDADLITILLAEAGRGGLDGFSVKLEAKLEGLVEVIGGVIEPLIHSSEGRACFTPSKARAAIAVYVLGSLYTIRLSRSAGLAVSEGELLDFVGSSIEGVFGMKLDAEALVTA